LLALDSATINGVAKRLRARQLIQTLSDPDDQRKRLLTLTPKGVAVIARAEHIGQLISEATPASLSTAERQRLHALLRKMIGPTRRPGAHR